ncbi:MAG TPA: SDR family NAD(P)-dependent oxidoreductase, partial [Microlunatus sp.]|nr:SDR family NAD(P)-dependent oxidoreductase [Microlunatus sp.]
MTTPALTPLPDLTDRTVIVTGATSGVGRATAAALAGAGARVVLAVRNQAKGDAVAADLGRDRAETRVEVRLLDLADLSSVRRFAAAWTEPVDVLINNAGVMATRRTETADGFE